MLESSWVHVVSLAPWRFPSLSCFNVISFALLCFLFSVVFSFLVSVFSICLLVTSCFTLKCTFLSCVSFTFLDYVHPSNLETFVVMLPFCAPMIQCLSQQTFWCWTLLSFLDICWWDDAGVWAVFAGMHLCPFRFSIFFTLVIFARKP